MSRILRISYRCPGVRFGRMSGSAVVLIDNKAVCRLRNLENADVVISEEEHTISVKLDRVLIFKEQIGAGTHDWTLALELKGSNITDARLKYPLYENIPSNGDAETLRRLSFSYIKDENRDRPLLLYLDGRCIASLNDSMDKEFEISGEEHIVQIKSHRIWPCYTDKISAGGNSWQLIGEGTRFMLEEFVPYWVRIVPREKYAQDAAVHSFCGSLPLLQLPRAGIPAVSAKAFFAAWNKACPFIGSTEKWVCFVETEHTPEAIIQRFSANDYRISYFSFDDPEQAWFNPLTAINMIRINDEPVPIPDVQRGCWIAELPQYSPFGRAYASVYVEYIGYTMYWNYHSVDSREVSMGHYEDDSYDYHVTHEESEFSSRDQLLQTLMDFIPRYPENHIESVPAVHHTVIHEDKLQEALAPFFR